MFRAEHTLHVLFKNRLTYTKDPEQADFFYVPVYAACAMTHQGWKATNEMLIDLWKWLHQNHGAIVENRLSQHVWPMTRTLGLQEFAKGDFRCQFGCGLEHTAPYVLEGIASGILLSHFAPRVGSLWNGAAYFNADKDISIPYDLGDRHLSVYQPLEGASESDRRPWLAEHVAFKGWLASFHGRIHRDRFAGFISKESLHNKTLQALNDDFWARPRLKLVELYPKGTNVLIVPFEHSAHSDQSVKRGKDQWLEELKQSRFYLAPAGSGMQSTRFFESLFIGRVPVILADDWLLPFRDWIDYQLFS